MVNIDPGKVLFHAKYMTWENWLKEFEIRDIERMYHFKYSNEN